MTVTASDIARRSDAVLAAVSEAVVGKQRPLELTLAAVLAGGHVLLEDLPGLGKTLAARSFAQALGLEFARAQFTPDLLPSDLVGSFIYNQATGTFEMRQGPVFTQFLLADEINRTPPKTQAALLEAMQESQVTIEGQTFALPRPFHVIATANPIEHEGTYPLPEAQVDRFLLRISFGYPDAEEEAAIVTRRLDRKREAQTVPQVVDAETLLAMQAGVEVIHVDPRVTQYAVALVAGTRAHADVLVGASPRGTLALITCGRALAAMRGRDYVIPEDIAALAEPALAHRVTLKPELWLTSQTTQAVIADVVTATPMPDIERP